MIEIVECEGLVDRADKLGRYVRERLTQAATAHPQLTTVRGRGPMNGFDVFADPDQPVVDAPIGRGVEDFCRERGVTRFVAVVAEAMVAVSNGTARSKRARHAFTGEYELRTRRARGLKAAAEWTSTRAPSDWAKRIRRSV
jgi:acetylornithine/succinyldiaminopimelate/putrescine aminotransferase